MVLIIQRMDSMYKVRSVQVAYQGRMSTNRILGHYVMASKNVPNKERNSTEQ